MTVGVASAWMACGAATAPTKPTAPTSPPASAFLTDTVQSATGAVADVRELLGHVDPATHPDFVAIPTAWCAREGLMLRTEACSTFVAMAEAAALEGIRLEALSATRTFAHQRSIWERKWSRPRYMGWEGVDIARDILTYSSMPGSSRHHWGTDIDLHSLESDDFTHGEGQRVVAWLRANAEGFGFVEVYTEDPARTGYLPEPWHWSYMPLAEAFLAQLEEARARNELPAFAGFSGAELADSLGIFDAYMRGIHRP